MLTGRSGASGTSGAAVIPPYSSWALIFGKLHEFQGFWPWQFRYSRFIAFYKSHLGVFFMILYKLRVGPIQMLKIALISFLGLFLCFQGILLF